MFHIVEFLDSKEVDIIPTNWLNKDHTICSWPSYKSTSKLTHSAKNSEAVSENWRKYPVKVLRTFDDYESAKKRLPETDFSSDSISEHSETGNTANQSIVLNYDDNDEEVIEESDSNLSNMPFIANIPDFLKTDSRSNILPDDGPVCNSSSTVPYSAAESEINSSVIDSQCSKHQACNQVLVKLINDIKQTADLHTYMLKQILNGNDGSESERNHIIPTNPPPFLLPLTTFEDVEAFNTYLRNENNFKASCAYFATFGGRNTKETVKLIIKYLMTDEVGLLFTWEGRRGSKKAFKDMAKICDLVYSATVKNPRCKGATITEVYDQMKSWIKYAMMRIERSKLRAVTNSQS